MEATMTPEDALEHLEQLKAGEERASGDSRKWKAFTAEPNAVIKSTLEFCSLCQYLDLIVQYTQNKKDVFLSMDKADLRGIGIEDENHCVEIEKAIKLIAGKRARRKPVTLREEEAVQILANINENLKNLDLGMYMYMDELIKKKPTNYFVSETSESTTAHDALHFIRTTKHVYQHLVKYLHTKQVVTDKEYKMIVNKLSGKPPSKRSRMKWFALALTLGSAVALGFLIVY